MKRVLALVILLTTLVRAEPTYDELLARARAQDSSLDFAALRLAYTRTAEYDPYATDTATLEAAGKALQSKDFSLARQHVDTLLGRNYVDLDGHILAYEAASGLGDEAAKKQHGYMLDGLFGSIVKQGDGRSMKTAWIVIGPREEYVVARLMEAELVEQALVHEGGHHYDVLTVKKRGGSAQTTKLYFNIDLPFAWMEQNLK